MDAHYWAERTEPSEQVLPRLQSRMQLRHNGARVARVDGETRLSRYRIHLQ